MPILYEVKEEENWKIQKKTHRMNEKIQKHEFYGRRCLSFLYLIQHSRPFFPFLYISCASFHMFDDGVKMFVSPHTTQQKKHHLCEKSGDLLIHSFVYGGNGLN